MSADTFLEPVRLSAIGPRAFARNVERLLWHLAFSDVRNIDGAGDEGGDILATRGGFRWVFQSKWKASGTVSNEAVKQVDAAKAFYSADRAVVVTNARLSRKAREHRERLLNVGVRVDFWDHDALAKFAAEILPEYVPARYTPYNFQSAAIESAKSSLDATGRSLIILATGLGKTLVGGEVINWFLQREPTAEILVVAHMRELVGQLERAMWRHVPKTISTQVLSSVDTPSSFSGVTCSTVQSALSAVKAGWRPGLVLVDEAHHAAEQGMFQELLDLLQDVPTIGLTATPWRGDGYQIAQRFGEPNFTMGIAEGMAKGFLAQVDYRLFVDTIDWATIPELSQHGLTIKDLNHRLFLPQRDEAVIDHLRDAWRETVNPRAILFCRTIDHAEEIARQLRDAGWKRAACISTRQTRRERDLLMSEFQDGRVPIVTTVDIFNEGVDVPDVNILAFLRVTHSRRIFVQQLGRGLRLGPGKERVLVLDFVSDIRRIAATLDLKRALQRLAQGEIERLSLPQSTVSFNEPAVGSLLEEWIKDAAALEDANDEVRLQYPDIG